MLALMTVSLILNGYCIISLFLGPGSDLVGESSLGCDDTDSSERLFL